MTQRVVHPFLFATFGVVFLYAISTATVDFTDIATVFVGLLAAVAVLWVLLGRIITDTRRRGFVLTIALLGYFFCVPLSEVLSFASYRFLESEMPYPIFMTAVLIAIPTISIVRGILNAKCDFSALTRFMNVFTMCAVCVATVQAAKYVVTGHVEIPTISTELPKDHAPPSEGYPDIYYIILDAYVRDDIFSEIYGGDNTPFLAHLKDQGFHVVEKARSNYSQTHQSLASSLNLTHLTDLAEKQGKSSINRRPLRTMILQNATAKFLREQGYTFVAFSSGFNASEWKDADVFLEPEEPLSEFESLLAMAIPVPGIAAKARKGYTLHRDRIEYIFDTLPTLDEHEGPTFVVAHILAPHPPFVFAADGTPRDPVRTYNLADGLSFMLRDTYDNYVAGYRDQCTYITARVQETVDQIIAHSPNAVIVVQGDHGSRSSSGLEGDAGMNVRERLSILNAYRLPGGGDARLYPDITPVNTFRVIFNHYFGTQLEMLPDESYNATLLRPYDLENVTDRVKKEPKGS
jgi:hypothetical protein